MTVTTVLVTLAIGGAVMAAFGLITYMSALVKNAYELKVELQAEMAESLKRIEEDVDKKAKWVKRDLVEEIQKSKDALSADIARRLQEVQDVMNKRLVEQEEAGRRERAELALLLDVQKQAVASLEDKLRVLQHEQRQMIFAPKAVAVSMPSQDADASALTPPPADAIPDPEPALAG